MNGSSRDLAESILKLFRKHATSNLQEGMSAVLTEQLHSLVLVQASLIHTLSKSEETTDPKDFIVVAPQFMMAELYKLLNVPMPDDPRVAAAFQALQEVFDRSSVEPDEDADEKLLEQIQLLLQDWEANKPS